MKKLVIFYWVITAIGSILAAATSVMIVFGLSAIVAPYVGLEPYQLQTMFVAGVILVLSAIPFMFTKTAKSIIIAVGVYCIGFAGLIATGIAGLISPYLGMSPRVIQTMVVASIILTAPARLSKLIKGQ